MQQIILSDLIRQAKGTELLCQLLREEYALLRAGEPDRVAALEMSIQDLIRQLVRERETLTGRLRAADMAGLAVFLETLSPEDRLVFETWRARIVAHEQDSGQLASVNAELAMALWKQSGVLLRHFQEQVAPRQRTTYSAKGTWQDRATTATLVRGRL